MQRIYVDFNTMMMSEDGGVTLNLTAPLNRDVHVQDGDRVLLYDEEVEVVGTVTYDAHAAAWTALPDWTTRQFVHDTPVPERA